MVELRSWSVTRVAAAGPKAEGAGATLVPGSQFPFEARPTPPSHASAHAARTTSLGAAHAPRESSGSDTRTQSDFAAAGRKHNRKPNALDVAPAMAQTREGRESPNAKHTGGCGEAYAF